MIRFSPQSLLQLSKLNRAVQKSKGIKHDISDEAGIQRLLHFVQADPDDAFNDLCHAFLNELSPTERQEIL
ncbi:MAG: hypothetical protein P8176_11715 [Gammaproteobacteria bacterium]